ncbi:MAG: cation transporter [Armatimonadetes bacterium]|nr:cation transporter [Armatimonadota bacterium]
MAHPMEWKIVIKGMTCEGCAAHLESELRKITGVSRAEVCYRESSAVVIATPAVSDSDLKIAVTRAGYSVLFTRRTSGAQGGEALVTHPQES